LFIGIASEKNVVMGEIAHFTIWLILVITFKKCGLQVARSIVWTLFFLSLHFQEI